MLPTTAYPFPAGATLVRGVVKAAGVALNGALVTTALLAQPGQFPVVVISSGGPTSVPQNLVVVTTPVIDSIDPATVIAGSAAFPLTVEGSGFVSGAVAKLEWTRADHVSRRELVIAQVTAAQVANAGQFTVIVANPDGTVSNQQNLTVAQAPAIGSIDPPSVTAGSAPFTLTVLGSGFAAGASVQLSGTALTTTFVSSTQLTAQVTSAEVANAAQLNVDVVNPGPPPQSSNTAVLAVVGTPVINSLDPAAVVAGSAAFSMTLLGSGFVSGAVVKLNATALTTAFMSATELTAQVPAAQVASAAQLSVVVTNPDGTASNTPTLAVIAAPTISSIDPAQVTADSAAFMLIVRGTGFASSDVVELNGTGLTTTFVSSAELDVHVPRSGYTTGADGTFVLVFDDIQGLSQVETLIVTHPSYPKPKLLDVTVLRGATVSVDIDMSS